MMKIAILSIDIEIFKNMLCMSATDMHELVETVGMSASMNDNLLNAGEDKIVVAMTMLQHARNMLEQCHCKIDININHANWTEPVSYTTDMHHKEEQ